MMKPEPLPWPRSPALYADIDDTGSDAIHHGRDGLRVGVEQLVVRRARPGPGEAGARRDGRGIQRWLASTARGPESLG